MIRYALSLTLLLLACGNESSNRKPVSGTNPKTTDAPSSSSQSTTPNGNENTQTGNDESQDEGGDKSAESGGASREETGFTCALGEIKFKDDSEAVQVFKADSMFIEDKDKNSTGGIFNYKAPNIAAQQGYVIGIVPDKAASPGKSFLGLVSLVRGTQRLTSCAKESSKNYTFPFDHGIYQKAIGVTPAEMVQADFDPINKGAWAEVYAGCALLALGSAFKKGELHY